MRLTLLGTLLAFFILGFSVFGSNGTRNASALEAAAPDAPPACCADLSRRVQSLEQKLQAGLKGKVRVLAVKRSAKTPALCSRPACSGTHTDLSPFLNTRKEFLFFDDLPADATVVGVDMKCIDVCENERHVKYRELKIINNRPVFVIEAIDPNWNIRYQLDVTYLVEEEREVIVKPN